MIVPTLAQVAGVVEKRLIKLFDQIEREPFPGLFATPLNSDVLFQIRDLTLRSGKRLRPALLVYGAELFDATASKNPAVVDACAALELLHTYLLIHDDIMDEDELRRGGPSAHTALADATGDRQLGANLGILAGDLAAAIQQYLLSELEVDAETQAKVNRLFASMLVEVVYGQCLDLKNDDNTEEIALRKTASYTTIGPVSIGATLANAPPDEVEYLANLARPLGIAFQLRDDLIGVFGRSEDTGKPMGTDLKNGKRTLLLQSGIQLADEDQLKLIDAVIGQPDASEEAITAACDALSACGAKATCEQKIDDLVKAFIDGLSQGSYLQDGRNRLTAIARFISERKW